MWKSERSASAFRSASDKNEKDRLLCEKGGLSLLACRLFEVGYHTVQLLQGFRVQFERGSGIACPAINERKAK